MSLNDFLNEGPSTMSWADEEVVLPSAPMSSNEPPRTTMDGSFERRDHYTSARREEYARPQRDPVPFPTEAPFTAFVGNLPLDTDEQQLRAYFGASVKSVRLIRNRETAKLKGFGYVEFETLDGLKDAVAMDGKELGGRALRIDVSETRDNERSDDRPAGSSIWRRAEGPSESTSPFASRSSSGFGRSTSGFGRSSSGFGDRAPRDTTAKAPAADEPADWRAHKNPPAAPVPAPAEGAMSRRSTFGDRFSRSSSGAGESREEPKNWRRDSTRDSELPPQRRELREHQSPREPRRPRDRSGSREPRAPAASEQKASWRVAKPTQQQDEESNKPQTEFGSADTPAAEDASAADAPTTTTTDAAAAATDAGAGAAANGEGWSPVDKPAARRAAPAGRRERESGSGDKRAPRSGDRRNASNSFFRREGGSAANADDSAGWRRGQAKTE
ncbi:hypothetical protein BX070DRAFT_236600 [Coemansia spiralis]|nr:hypothetical protein BX070DRAFT_236600 [Coemansia spiralis]